MNKRPRHARADDEQLAKTLVLTGALTAEEMASCRDGQDLSLIDAAVSRGFVSPDQVEQARRDLSRTWALRRDAALARFAIQHHFITRDDVVACRKVQRRRAACGEQVDLLEIMIEERCVSRGQATFVAAAVNDRGHRRLGDFEVLAKLGEGGMGTVYKARRVTDDRIVALKLLPRHLARERGLLKRFYREAEVTTRLRHPNVVAGLAAGRTGGRHYFAMEFVDGGSLKDVIENEGAMPLDRAVPLFIDVASALAYAHVLGLVHRDIKPENVLLTLEGAPKLADLGLAKESALGRTEITMTGVALGTAYYMPPEQARDAKRADRRSDIYALGATFYHVLTGRVPYPGDSAFDVLNKHQTATLQPPHEVNSAVPDPVSRVITRMLRKRPRYRYQSADDVVQALTAVPLPGRPSPPPGAGELWYVWLAGSGGVEDIAQFSRPALVESITAGQLPLDAAVRRACDDHLRPIVSVPELADAAPMGRPDADPPPADTPRRSLRHLFRRQPPAAPPA